MDRARYLVGLLVLVATCVGAWLLLGLLDNRQASDLFALQVEFRDVAGLKAGGDVKYRGVRLGHVDEIGLTGDGTRAVVSLRLEKKAINLLRANSRFWIVTPRFYGVREGLSGLDTLVRNAYIAFITPLPMGEPLAAHSQLIGEEVPYVLEKELNLPRIEHGDLRMHLLVPENHGLHVGALVLFRGMPTGEIRHLALAADGTHVDVALRIDRRYRTTVTDKSRFWVARPHLSGAIFTGFSVQEMGALISPYVAYFTAPGEGVPAPEDHRVLALPTPPDLGEIEVPKDALQKNVSSGAVDPKAFGEFALVLVKYSAEDVDWLSPNDRIYREGVGIVYADRQGRLLVLTARSVCDARYDYRETFGDKGDIRKEEIRVRLPGGQWVRGNRIASGKDERDLVVLRLSSTPSPLTPTESGKFHFVDKLPTGSMTTRTLNTEGVPQKPETLVLPKKLERAGVPVVSGGHIIGLLGRKSAEEEEPVVVLLDALPESLRPK